MASRIFNVDDDIDPYHDFQPLPDIPDLFRVKYTQQSTDASRPDAQGSFRVENTQQSAGDFLPDIPDQANLFSAKIVPKTANDQDTEMPDASQSQEIIRETPTAEEVKASQEAIEKEYIDHLLRPDPRPADAPPTQGMSSQIRMASTSLMLHPGHMPPPTRKKSAIGDTGAGERSSELASITKVRKLVLSKAKYEESKKKKQRKSKTPKVKRSRRKDIISCQCGDIAADDGGMLCCDSCNEWQHAQCYGYNSVKDPRIADEHYCYNCLLHGVHEKPLLQTLEALAFFRHGLSYIWFTEQFPTSIDVLAAELRMFPNQSH